MKRRTTNLIKSPPQWHMAAAPVGHPAIPPFLCSPNVVAHSSERHVRAF
jgi:hypothetical protein